MLPDPDAGRHAIGGADGSPTGTARAAGACTQFAIDMSNAMRIVTGGVPPP
jgi:hypothetical protein